MAAPMILFCKYCTASYNRQSSLKEHMKKRHPEIELPVRNTNAYRCPLCKENQSKQTILDHFKTTHSLEIKVSNENFTNYDAFLDWKKQIEKSTKARFSKYSSQWKNNHKEFRYNCHRSGFYKSHGKGKRKSKTSFKIDGFCPAEIIVRLSQTNVAVTFIETHVGHEMDLEKTWLSEEEKQAIAAKIASGVPYDKILDEVRNSVSTDSVERVHLLKRQDLNNIKRSRLFQVSDNQSSEVENIDSWITEMQGGSLLQFYKAQGQPDNEYGLKEEDFILILYSDYQLQMLKAFGPNLICVDGTHAISARHEFELFSILVMNDSNEVLPCAFMVSNRFDENVFKIFFRTVKKSLGGIDFTCRAFMSDMAQDIYSSWKDVFGPSQSELYSLWHLDRAWRTNSLKISDPLKKTEAYKIMRSLLEEPNIDNFETNLANTLQQFEHDTSLIDFGLHIKAHYYRNKQSWAYCYRLSLDPKSNTNLEEMHRALKYIITKWGIYGKLVKVLQALQKIIDDKLFNVNRINAVSSEKEKSIGKLKKIRFRHEASKKMKNYIIIDNSNYWEIQCTSTSRNFVISLSNTTCDCELKCPDCDICAHHYHCSCANSEVNWNFCKHIHFLHTNRPKEIVFDPNSSSTQYLAVDESGSMEVEITFSGVAPEPLNLDEDKRELIADWTNLVEMCNSQAQIDALKEAFRTTKSHIEVLQEEESQLNKQIKIQPQQCFLTRNSLPCSINFPKQLTYTKLFPNALLLEDTDIFY